MEHFSFHFIKTIFPFAVEINWIGKNHLCIRADWMLRLDDISDTIVGGIGNPVVNHIFGLIRRFKVNRYNIYVAIICSGNEWVIQSEKKKLNDLEQDVTQQRIRFFITYTYLRLFLVNIALATPKLVATLFVVLKLRTNSLVIVGLISRIACAISSSVRPAAAVLSRDSCNCGWIGESTKFPIADGSFDPFSEKHVRIS